MNKNILLILILGFGCSQNEEIAAINELKLVKIEYSYNDNSWSENYSYDSDKYLSQIENLKNLGTRYEMEYSNGTLKEFSTYRIDIDKHVFRDSILYDPNGRIKEIYNFSSNHGPDLPLAWVYEYEYDSSGMLSKKGTYSKAREEYSGFERYFWNGNNVERLEVYSGSDELRYEYFFEYDDKTNYKSSIPYHIKDPVNWGKNNVTEMNWKDYVGNLDLICNPCETFYKYNSDDYPIELSTNTGSELKLEYEQ